MLVRHEMEIQCNCPSDDLPDLYHMTVECERTIPVEKIMEVVDELSKEKIFQEELTQRIARLLNARVTTIGWHFGRVKTTVSA